MLNHALRRAHHLFALAALAWLAPAVLLAVVLVLAGPDGASANLALTVSVGIVGVVIGHVVVVPAMFALLHRGTTIRGALAFSREWLRPNLLMAAPIPVVVMVGYRFVPEVYGTVSEALFVQALLAMPFILWAQAAWMQQVAYGGDLRDVVRDAAWSLRRHPVQMGGVLVPSYVVCWLVVMPLATPVLTGPVVVALLTVPYAVGTWIGWSLHMGVVPPAVVLDAPTVDSGRRPVPASAGQPATATPAAAVAVAAVPHAPELRSGAGDRLELVSAAGHAPAGAWFSLDDTDTLTCSVRVPDDSRMWAAYVWTPDGAWRELEQLWNDGRHMIAWVAPRSSRCFVAIRRRDGQDGVPFTLWTCVATSRAVELPVNAAA